MNDYLRKLALGSHLPSHVSQGLSWLMDPQRALCPKNCHDGVTAADAVAYADHLRAATPEDPRPLLRAYLMGESLPVAATATVPRDVRENFLTRQPAWTELRHKVDALLREKGAAIRPAAVHILGDFLLDVVHLKGRVQRRHAISDLDAREVALDIGTHRILGDAVAGMKRQEAAIAHWAERELASSLGQALTASEWGIVGDLFQTEGALAAAQEFYVVARDHAASPSEAAYFQAQVLDCRVEESFLSPDESLRAEIVQAYHETHAAIQSAAVPQAPIIAVGGVSLRMTIGHTDQLHIAAAILGRLYHSVLIQDASPDDRTLSILELELHHHLTTRATVATLPEAIHVTAFAQAVVQRYTAPGGVLSRQHIARDESIASTVARVQELVQFAESFGPSDAVSAAVLTESRAPMAWMGAVDAHRRVGRPWEALQAVPALESRYAQTDSFKKFKLALYREAPQHFTTDLQFSPTDVATGWDGVSAAAQEGSRSLDGGASPWRRFFVDTGTTLTGAGVGLAAGGPPGAAIGAVVGGVYGEAGNAAITAVGDRDAIAQSARAGLSDVSPRAAQAALGAWGGSLMLGSALRALGGWGLGASMISRFGTTAPIRTALMHQLSQPERLWHAVRTNPAGLFWGTSSEGRALLWRHYWFRLGMMAVGLDIAALHTNEAGKVELGSDWKPDTIVGKLGFLMMLGSPQVVSLLTPAGRQFWGQWLRTELWEYGRVVGRAGWQGLRGLVTGPVPKSNPVAHRSLQEWQSLLQEVIARSPESATKEVTQFSLEEWWQIFGQLRARAAGTTATEVMATEEAAFVEWFARRSPTDATMGRSYWWDGWRHARLSALEFPKDMSLYQLANANARAAASVAKSKLPDHIRNTLDSTFGAVNRQVDRTLRLDRLMPWWEDRLQAASHAVRSEVPEFFKLTRGPALAKEVNAAADMVARRGYESAIETLFGNWNRSVTARFPKLQTFFDICGAFLSKEVVKAHRYGVIPLAIDKLSDGQVNTWPGVLGGFAAWNLASEKVLGYNTVVGTNVSSAIFVFTMAFLRKGSGGTVLDHPETLIPNFWLFHAGSTAYQKVLNGVHAPGLTFFNWIPGVRHLFPSITSIPPAMQLGIDLTKPNIKTPLGYGWSVIVGSPVVGIGVGDRFSETKLADATGYLGKQRLLKFVAAALFINPWMARLGMTTGLGNFVGRSYGFGWDWAINQFTPAYMGGQLFAQPLAHALKSEGPEKWDVIWELFCDQNTSLSATGFTSVREDDDRHPLEWGYRWDPLSLNNWVEWEGGDHNGMFEKLAASKNSEGLVQVIAAYRRQLLLPTAAWRQVEWVDTVPVARRFTRHERDGMGIVIFGMIAKYYAQKGWAPFQDLVNDRALHEFWQGVPSVTRRRELNRMVEQINDRELQWETMVHPLL